MSFLKTVFHLLLALPLSLLAQKETPIVLSNPSFEDVPKISSTPIGWYDCGQMKDSPPDVQPGSWGVSTAPNHGNTYMGMVVRDNETWEGVSQRLSRPLEINHCYELTMFLSKADKYLSASPLSSLEKVDFATPACIVIRGGNGYCDKGEILARSTIINHSRWVSYNFRLSPKKSNYSFIYIEAYYKTPVLFPYNGHVLVDNLSAIIPIACGPEKMPEARKATPPVAAKTPTKPPIAAPKITPVPAKPEAPVADKPAVAIGNSVKKNVIYHLEKVYFDANKFEVKTESEAQLYELLTFLRKRPDVIIEVGGHTNNAMWPNDAFAMELSTNRAKAVANWLITKGIPAKRVQYKGYGWTKPIMPNNTADGRKKNQRVEATILSSN